MKFKLLQKKRLREKAQIILNQHKQILFKSIIKCSGSKVNPDCDKWLFTNGYMKQCRDMLINGLTESPNQEDRDLVAEILDQCFYCMIDHPELKPHIPKKVMRLINLSRRKLR